MKDTQLTPEVRRLVKAMAAFNLSFDQAAEYIGIAGNTIRRWVRGEFEPNPVYRKMIADAVEKMRTAFGVEGRFDYLDLASDEEQGVHLELLEIEDHILNAETAKLLEGSWKGFCLIYRALRLRKIWGAPRKGVYGRPK